MLLEVLSDVLHYLDLSNLLRAAGLITVQYIDIAVFYLIYYSKLLKIGIAHSKLIELVSER